MDHVFSEKWPHICFRKNWTLDSEISRMLGECEAYINSLTYLPIIPGRRQELQRVALIKGAMATTAIEGNTLSEEEARRVFDGESLPPSLSYQETEIRNVIEALNNISRSVVGDNEGPLINKALILSLHQAVGKKLGDAFEAAPGRFREGGHEVVVGQYRAPDCRFVPEAVDALCSWLQSEFGYTDGSEHDFNSAVVEAIVLHVYIAWIHPFGDGNGRTARLLEFYTLLRAGVPDICAHILSNHYNRTRPEYYRQLAQTGKSRGNLTEFIRYALTGFRDGLREVVAVVQEIQVETAWKNYIYAVMDEAKIHTEDRKKRIRSLVLSLPVGKQLSQNEMMIQDAKVAKLYLKAGNRALASDVTKLVELKLLEEIGDGCYECNISPLVIRMPRRRVVGAMRMEDL